ncbi:uncharacterized protein DS421_15g512820 [Arachis hypogaea]|nr:uncharacterized protein DS421_15g512820 [Arachis hypogaea]
MERLVKKKNLKSLNFIDFDVCVGYIRKNKPDKVSLNFIDVGVCGFFLCSIF